MKPSTIKLFLATGSPEGLRTAELSNWSGKAIASPRSQLDQFLKREELMNPGVYVLVGHDDEADRPRVYIGEAEKVSSRLRQHTVKDFWQHAIVFMSKDENITKSHIRFLEGELIQIALASGRSIVENGQSSGAKLPESDRADMEGYLERILQLLPILGVTAFKPSIASTSGQIVSSELFCVIKGLQARGKRTESGFVVYKGSQAVLAHRDSAVNTRRKREKLVLEGVLVEHSGALEFSADYEFSSPSAAASTVRGGNSNGLTCWKDADKRTLKELELG